MSVISLSNDQKRMLKVSLILSSIDAQVQAALYVPILALIIQTFGDSSLVNFSFSVTSGVMVVVVFIAGHLAKRFDKRDLMMVGTAIFMLGGFCGALAPTIEILVLTRVIEGIGAGLVYPMVPAITAQVFENEERTQVMGFLNGGACIIAFILNFAAGAVGALYGWRICLYIYAILAVAIFLQYKYIPKLGPEKNLLGNKDEHGNKLRVPKAVYWLTLGNAVFNSCCMIFNITLSNFIVTSSIGTTAVAGTAGSVQTFVGFIIGLIFGKLIIRLGKFVPAVALGLLAIGYFSLSQATTPMGVYFSIAFVGMCPGIIFPYINECVARVSPASVVTLGMSYVSIGMLLGTFMTSFFVMFLSSITGDSYTGMYIIVGSGSLCAAAIFAIIGIVRTVKQRKQPQQ